MIVCLCRRISDHDIEHAVRGGVHDFDALQEETGVARSCGCCEDCAREVFDGALRAERRKTVRLQQIEEPALA